MITSLMLNEFSLSWSACIQYVLMEPAWRGESLDCMTIINEITPLLHSIQWRLVFTNNVANCQASIQ